MRKFSDIFVYLAMALTVVAMLVASAVSAASGPPETYSGSVATIEHVHVSGHASGSGAHSSTAHEHALDTMSASLTRASLAGPLALGWTLASDRGIVSATSNIPEQPPKLAA